MGSREAFRKLREVGFEYVRHGKGDHIIMRKGTDTIVFPDGKKDIRSGLVRRIEYTLKKFK